MSKKPRISIGDGPSAVGSAQLI